MSRIVVSGVERSAQTASGAGGHARVLAEIAIQSQRAVGAAPVELSGYPLESLAEARFEGPDGPYTRWLTMRELRDTLAAEQPSRGVDEALEIAPESLLPVRERGLGGWVLKVLRVLDVDPVAETAKGIANFYDAKLVAAPGVYTVAGAALVPVERLDQLAAEDEPYLVFVHGTASNTEGSFGALHPRVWDAIRTRYSGRILALEHHTLACSPMDNLIELMTVLPANARLHVVSHSRGGLVVELLCRGQRLGAGVAPFDEVDLELFSEREDQAHQLRTLGRLLAEKAPRVERFVRVGCPAGGTTLASGRLDRALEIMFNGLSAVIPGAISPVAEVVKDFLLDVKKQSANAEAMPGLEAMVPGSPVVRLLNRADVTVAADLSVIAGDIEGSGLLARLGVFATDLFYREDHDLVVHTRAMYGGARRTPDAQGARYYFTRGDQVSHFRYFSNRDSADRVLEGLTRKAGEQAPGFLPLDRARRLEAGEVRRDLVDRISDRVEPPEPTPDMPVVFVIPGIMGSLLEAEGDRVWVDPLGLGVGQFRKLSMGSPGVKAVGLIGSSYARFVRHLAFTHRVVTFPFDWRLPVSHEGRRLARALRRELEATAVFGNPVRIVAHSMGGLVSRAALTVVEPEAGETPLLDLLQARDGFRFVMAGTPNGGSFTVPRVLLGEEGLVQALAAVDLRHDQARLLGWISEFQGFIDMLPCPQQGELDLLQSSAWDELAAAADGPWASPTEPALAAARDLRSRLDTGVAMLEREHTCYVAGVAPTTPSGLSVDTGHDGRVRAFFRCSAEGDGRVPWGETQFLDMPTWYMNAVHGDLLVSPEAFDGLVELLERGTTRALPSNPPGKRGAGEEALSTLPKDILEIFPDQEILERFAIGGGIEKTPQAPVIPALEVRVSHGNLAFVEAPMLVGHYAGDALLSAESQLDRFLDGALSVPHRLGVYPGALGTSEVFLAPRQGRFLPGAVVVGLGVMGELSAGTLQETLTLAFIRYALYMRRLGDRDSGDTDGSLRLCSLLIGSGEDGVLPRESAETIVRAALDANLRLAERSELGMLYIGDLELVELYRDTALEALGALQSLQEPAHEVRVAPALRIVEGGQERIKTGSSAYHWPRIYARGRGSGMVFTVPTNRARIEDSPLAVDLRTVRRMVDETVTSHAADDTLPRALYELLIPNRLKQFHQHFNRLVLVVDPDTAIYPWELLRDGRSADSKPLSVRMGFVRKFATSRFDDTVRCVRNRRALVVGNPLPTGFIELPGASEEAHAVANLLGRNEFEVIQLRDEQATISKVMGAVMAEDVQVLHLAGHGVHDHEIVDADGKSQRVSGMIIGRNAYLSAEKVKQLRSVPEVVFINCCHLGRTDEPESGFAEDFKANEFAASISRAFIERGARAVVAAGWAVDDSAARQFAEGFYRALFAGDSFGDAVRIARNRIYGETGKQSNTWGAYQAYGDPDYRLQAGARRPESTVGWFADNRELITHVRNLMQQSKTASLDQVDDLRRHLDELVQEIERTERLENRPSSLNDPRVCEVFGLAYGELYEFDKAARYLEVAVPHARSQVSVRSLEQWLNFRARRAAECALRARDAGEQIASVKARGAGEQIASVITELEQIVQLFGQSDERLALMGSAWKRMAMACPDHEEALQRACAAYQACGGVDDGPGFYAGTNLLLLQGLRYWRNEARSDRYHGGDGSKALSAERARLDAQVQGDPSTDFWTMVGSADLELACSVVRGDLETHEVSIADGYLSVALRFGSRRELLSVLDQVRTVEVLCDPRRVGNVPRTRGRTLQSLHEAAGRLLRTLATAWGAKTT